MRQWIYSHLWIFLLFFLTLVFFYQFLFHPTELISPYSDIPGIFYFEKLLFVNTIYSFHQLPLWNPYIFSGSPFVGNPSTAMFYPLNYIFLIFPLASSFGLMFMLDIFLIGCFTYLFTRSLGLSRFASLLSSSTCMFSGMVITKIYAGNTISLDTFVWLPLLFYFLEKLIVTRKFIYSLVSAICIAFVLVGGHTQVAFYVLIAAVFYAGSRCVCELDFFKNKRKSAVLIGFLVFAFLLGFGLAAVQLLPSSEFSKYSARSQGVDFEWASSYSLHPLQTITFVLPHIFGTPLNQTWWGKGNFWEECGYIGIIPLMFIVVALIYKRNKYVVIFFGISIFSLLFSFGKYTPLLHFLYTYIPGFNNFRVPARFLLVYGFTMSVIAGFGADAIIYNIQQKKFRKYAFTFLTIAFVISCLLLLGISLYYPVLFSFLLHGPYGKYLNNISQFSLLTVIRPDLYVLISILIYCIVLLYLFSHKKLTISTLKLCIISVVVIDLFLFGMPFITTVPVTSALNIPDAVKKLKNDQSYFRVFDQTGHLITPVEAVGLQQVTGIHSLYLRSIRDLLWQAGPHEYSEFESFIYLSEIKKSDILQVLNVKYIFSDKTLNNISFSTKNRFLVKEAIPNTSQAFLNKNYYLYINSYALPRVYSLSSTEYTRVEKLRITPKNYQNVTIKTYEPNRIAIHLKVKAPSYVIFSENWYPGWKAYDNGRKIQLLRTTFSQRSVFLNSGIHDIILQYQPDSYKQGLYISISSLMILVVLAGFYFRKTIYEVIKKIYRVK